jgi:hypothetical protein
MDKNHMILRQSNKHCILYAAAMILDEEPVVLAKELNFIGDKELWPSSKPPANLRGYHESEVISVALKRGVALVHFASQPFLRGRTVVPLMLDSIEVQERFMAAITGRRAIICGAPSEVTHAVAWDGGQIYDPAAGAPYSLDSFRWPIKFAMVAYQIESNQKINLKKT